MLKAVAEVLQTDPQAHAFRLGGEEFVLLLRGEDAQLRAERLRSGNPTHVATTVPVATRPVTASMSLTDAPPNADTEFSELYTQSDRLLYDAKQAVRDRTKVGSGAHG